MKIFKYLNALLVFSMVGSFTLPASGIVFDDNPSQTLTDSGLTTGNQFRLVFVTSQIFTPSSNDISTYNNLVDNVAANSTTLDNAISSLLGTDIVDNFSGNVDQIDWTAIGSTLSTDARDNTETNPNIHGEGMIIFNLRGNTIAENYDDLWDGTINSSIRYTEENGLPQGWGVWTGTGESGTKQNVQATGCCNWTLGTGRLVMGRADSAHGSWIESGPINDSRRRALYGISEPLTFQSQNAQPVPFEAEGTMGLVALGGFFWYRNRKKRTVQSNQANHQTTN